MKDYFLYKKICNLYLLNKPFKLNYITKRILIVFERKKIFNVNIYCFKTDFHKNFTNILVFLFLSNLCNKLSCLKYL